MVRISRKIENRHVSNSGVWWCLQYFEKKGYLAGTFMDKQHFLEFTTSTSSVVRICKADSWSSAGSVAHRSPKFASGTWLTVTWANSSDPARWRPLVESFKWNEGCGKPSRARSRLYRSQILQVNMRLKALAEIYTMHSFAQLCNLNFLSKFCQTFC